MKKIFVIICCFLLLLCGCSKESKFGIEQFVERVNRQYEYTLNTADFILGKDAENNNNLFLETDNILISLSLDEENNIIGLSLLTVPPNNIDASIVTFCQLSSILTGNDYNRQSDIMKVFDGKIKFTDNSFVSTVGKYKYTVVCNEHSITLFCDKV